jgi:flagellar hook protein FlgE
MGIFDALNTAVAGLQAQSFALQNISGNIANSQTTGYKETDTYFEDLVSAASLGQQTANGVIAGSVSTNTVQGTIQGTSVSTDMAINGDGWFVVSSPTGTSDNQPVFSGVDDYTRDGEREKPLIKNRGLWTVHCLQFRVRLQQEICFELARRRHSPGCLSVGPAGIVHDREGPFHIQ